MMLHDADLLMTSLMDRRNFLARWHGFLPLAQSGRNREAVTKAAMLTDRFDRALMYATHVHGGQIRKGTSTPYVAHLLAVAATVLEYGGDEDLAIAALLHDRVEDQGGRARLDDGSQPVWQARGADRRSLLG
jgi:hypothetical protein